MSKRHHRYNIIKFELAAYYNIFIVILVRDGKYFPDKKLLKPNFHIMDFKLINTDPHLFTKDDVQVQTKCWNDNYGDYWSLEVSFITNGNVIGRKYSMVSIENEKPFTRYEEAKLYFELYE